MRNPRRGAASAPVPGLPLRRGEREPTRIVEAVRAATEDADAVFAPGFPLIHADHRFRWRRRVTQPGWPGGWRCTPSSPTASPGTRSTSRALVWRRILAARRDRTAKWRAVLAYRTQLPLLQLSLGTAGGLLVAHEALRAARRSPGSPPPQVSSGPAMKLVETLIVRDEADIVDAQISYHLNAGVDFVLAIDHESRDGTTEILESYGRQGLLRGSPEQGAVLELEWRTHMARLAATEHGADWVLAADADEFWVPRGDAQEIPRRRARRGSAPRAA